MNSSQPLVSIAIITYNSSQYVEETIRSAFDQTYPNIEIIISDDCSTDNTFQVCKDIVEKIHVERKNDACEIKCIFTQTPKNGGITVNYNHALKFCNGKYIKYIAGDDLLMPDCISRFVEEAESKNGKILVCQSDDFNSNGKCGMHKYPPHAINLNIRRLLF